MAIYLKGFKVASMDQEAKMYLNHKMRMSTSGGWYPFNIFPEKEIEEFTFETPITILYSSNGSGKSTLLNLIAEKLKLYREAPYNRTHWFDKFMCHRQSLS